WEKLRQKRLIGVVAANRLKRMEEFQRTKRYQVLDAMAFPQWLYDMDGLFFNHTWFIAYGMQKRQAYMMATAIGIYQAETGKLPDKLGGQVTQYLSKPMVNPFDGKDFGYRISSDDTTRDVTLAKGQAVIWWSVPRWFWLDRQWVTHYQPIPKWAK